MILTEEVLVVSAVVCCVKMMRRLQVIAEICVLYISQLSHWGKRPALPSLIFRVQFQTEFKCPSSLYQEGFWLLAFLSLNLIG